MSPMSHSRPQPKGMVRVWLVPEELPRLHPSVLLECPHCSHTSVSTLQPEPCGQGLPLIYKAPEHPRRGQTLPEAFTLELAAVTTILFGVGERHMPTCVGSSQGPCPCRHMGTCLWAGDKWQGGDRDSPAHRTSKLELLILPLRGRIGTSTASDSQLL